MNNNATLKKPFCKVCYDTGKPESVYTSHWVRTLAIVNGVKKNNGMKITCPTLLATECRYCLKAGHTVKFCPIIEKRDKFMEKRKVNDTCNVVEEPCITSSSQFAVLSVDDDDEEIEDHVVTTSSCSWASIAAKPKAESEPSTPFSTPKTIPPSVIRRQTIITPAWSANKKFTKSWADYTDSDSDEDLELECN